MVIASNLLEPHRGFIVERLAKNSHLTLHGLKAELALRDISVSHNTIRGSSAARGCASKATLFALEQACCDVTRRSE
jgi:hypothetical protein